MKHVEPPAENAFQPLVFLHYLGKHTNIVWILFKYFYHCFGKEVQSMYYHIFLNLTKSMHQIIMLK